MMVMNIKDSFTLNNRAKRDSAAGRTRFLAAKNPHTTNKDDISSSINDIVSSMHSTPEDAPALEISKHGIDDDSTTSNGTSEDNDKSNNKQGGEELEIQKGEGDNAPSQNNTTSEYEGETGSDRAEEEIQKQKDIEEKLLKRRRRRRRALKWTAFSAGVVGLSFALGPLGPLIAGVVVGATGGASAGIIQHRELEKTTREDEEAKLSNRKGQSEEEEHQQEREQEHAEDGQQEQH